MSKMRSLYGSAGLFLVLAVIIVTAGLVEAKAADVERRVMAFYYPWYGTAGGPSGARRVLHWGRIDEEKKDIRASTHYPSIGAYDSHDEKVIDTHSKWARQAGIDTLIVSWWGHGDFTDRAMDEILAGCERNALKACIYYETVPRPQTARTAAEDIVKLLQKYGGHPAHLKVNGKPVVFIYGRAVGELGLTGWLEAVRIVNQKYEPGVVAIGDQFSFGAARVFDGVHTYNTAGSLRRMEPDEAKQWASGRYRSWVQLANGADKICAITVIPGYDDTKIREPGLAVERYGGRLYRVQWEQAIEADPHWILITSFNEWHEGSEIEPSLEYKDKYIELTAEYARRFKAKKRSVKQQASSGKFSADELAQLRGKLGKLRIGVLPKAGSMAFWWLLDMATTDTLTWEDLAAGRAKPQEYPILLYGADEQFRRSLHRDGDIDEAIAAYLAAGGCLVYMPSRPWPFHRDENGRVVNRSGQFGLTLQRGWETPPKDTKPRFVRQKDYLPHIPAEFAFPVSGDLRWRGFVRDDRHGDYTPLLRLVSGEDYLGDGIAYAELKNGGRICYVWFTLLNGPYAEAILYDVFDFLAGRVKQAGM